MFGNTAFMSSIISSLILFCCLYTSQLLCSARPIIIEMTHSYPLTGEFIQTRINLDDSVMERILMEPINEPSKTISEGTNTGSLKVNEEGSYDYYDMDCAMPVMPELMRDEKGKEMQIARQTNQSDQPRTYTVMDSIVGGLNGIAMSVAAAGMGVLNFLRPSS